MSDELFEELLAGVREGGAILRGANKPSRSFEVGAKDVRRIRDHYAVSEADFAELLGIRVTTLRN